MRFYIRQRRRPPAIIIVALIDILIVMLIFLMVTTTFRQQQPALKLALPESSQAVKNGAHENPPVVVSVDTQGNLRFGPDAKPVTIERLKEDLLAEAGTNQGVKLAIRADKAAPFGQIVKVMDAAKEAKIKTVNAYTKEAGSK